MEYLRAQIRSQIAGRLSALVPEHITEVVDDLDRLHEDDEIPLVGFDLGDEEIETLANHGGADQILYGRQTVLQVVVAANTRDQMESMLEELEKRMASVYGIQFDAHLRGVRPQKSDEGSKRIYAADVTYTINYKSWSGSPDQFA